MLEVKFILNFYKYFNSQIHSIYPFKLNVRIKQSHNNEKKIKHAILAYSVILVVFLISYLL